MRRAAVAALIVLAGRLKRELGAVSLQRVAFAAGVGPAVGLLMIGATLARRGDVMVNRALDWLLLGSWTMLFVLGP